MTANEMSSQRPEQEPRSEWWIAGGGEPVAKAEVQTYSYTQPLCTQKHQTFVLGNDGKLLHLTFSLNVIDGQGYNLDKYSQLYSRNPR